MNIVLKSESGKINIFWTNADLTMVHHTIKTCFGKNKTARWDRHTIKHELDWVGYHLKRFGFEIKQKKPNIQTHIYPNVKEIIIDWKTK